MGLRPGVEPGSVAYGATASPAMLPELESQVGLEPTKRSYPRQIKSLLPLPLGSLAHGALPCLLRRGWSRPSDSNRDLRASEARALPLELNLVRQIDELAAQVGIEPTTTRLTAGRSPLSFWAPWWDPLESNQFLRLFTTARGPPTPESPVGCPARIRTSVSWIRATHPGPWTTGQLVCQRAWSGRRESNSYRELGRLPC